MITSAKFDEKKDVQATELIPGIFLAKRIGGPFWVIPAGEDDWRVGFWAGPAAIKERRKAEKKGGSSGRMKRS